MNNHFKYLINIFSLIYSFLREWYILITILRIKINLTTSKTPKPLSYLKFHNLKI